MKLAQGRGLNSTFDTLKILVLLRPLISRKMNPFGPTCARTVYALALGANGLLMINV